MTRSIPRQIKMRVRRIARSNHRLIFASVIVLAITASVMGTIYERSRSVAINASAYDPLLSLIAHGESSGNYNAYYKNPKNTETQFTNMSVSEVLQWQENYVKNGSPSSAVGRYQIIRPTLVTLIKQQKIDTSQKFDAALQDRLAIALLEKRGSVKYFSDQLSREEFAANIAKEWAALPKVIGDNAEQSYYAGDGLNKSNIKVSEILQAIDLFKNSSKSN